MPWSIDRADVSSRELGGNHMPDHIPSVGVFIMPGGGPPELGWDETLAMAQRAEDLGFDSVWLPDHLIMPTPMGPANGIWECWTFLAAIAAKTTRVELGTLVAATSYRNPGLLAKLAEAVDAISSGRFTLGIGSGHVPFESHAYGFPYDRLASRFEEAIQIITGLIRDRQIDFEGTFESAHIPHFGPDGPRPGGIPVMAGVEGPRMTRIAARYADEINLDLGKSVESLPGHRDRIDAACREVGRDPATLRRSCFAAIDVSSSTLPGDEWTSDLFASHWHRGSTEALAEILRAHAAAGFERVQVWLNPMTVEGIEAFAPVLDLIRQN
jgi:alkanesulfonate monooxygenase SsuD/methylene tetrahydromethanopterin reductase-like flavin-dependent oxidoreductase (luciferase family)